MLRRPIRVLHTSDVHLGPSATEPGGRQHVEGCLCPIAVLDHLVEEHRIDVVIVAGDLFDHARVPDQLVVDTLARLGRLNADVALFPGNHDVHDETTVYRRNRSALDASGIAFFDDPLGGSRDLADGALRIWARAMEEHTPDFKPLAGSPAHPGDRWFVVGAHGHFSPPDGDAYRASRISVEDIDATQADYVALGHWHITTDLAERGTTIPAWYSGSPLFGHGSGQILLIDFNDNDAKRVAVQRLDVLNHPAAICEGLSG